MADQGRAFDTAEALEAWLAEHHASEAELLVRIYKKGSGQPSVTWEECVVAALAWGWIDGVKRSLDETAYLQRMTPRRAKSNWSKKNVGHVERLIAEGRMQPSGMVHVEAAKADGRWHAAYAGSSEMVIPRDFLEALDAVPEAKSAYDKLTRAYMFTIYHQLQSAKRPETRERRMAAMIDKLATTGLPK